MRIVVCLPHAVDVFAAQPEQLGRLQAQLPQHTLISAANEAELTAQLPEAEAVVVWRFEPEWYERAPKLFHVCTPAAGREHIAADPRGHVALHFGAFHGQIMAESLCAMVLFMNRNLGPALDAQRERRWDRSGFERVRRLAGQTALLVGYGAIARHAARQLGALGMMVDGLKRNVGTGAEGVRRLYALGELHTAVANADHVVCILPSDTGTDELIDAATIAQMKPSTCVYNIGRGNAIDTDALRAALAEGRLGGAFLDVFPLEPLPADSPLWQTPKLYLTPHASAMARDYLDLYIEELIALFGT
jgi:D-2-hydroxyacid dehydrogenase (NADP+)